MDAGALGGMAQMAMPAFAAPPPPPGMFGGGGAGMGFGAMNNMAPQ